MEIMRLFENYSAKKHKFSKHHGALRNMILMGSATYIDRIASLSVETCTSVFNTEMAGKAGQELALNFEAIGFSDVEFAYGTVI